MLTEEDGSKDSATPVAEGDDGSKELSVDGPAGAPPQAAKTAPSVSSIVIARGAPDSKLISFPTSPAMTAGPFPAGPDSLGLYYVFLNLQTPQQLRQQIGRGLPFCSRTHAVTNLGPARLPMTCRI